MKILVTGGAGFIGSHIADIYINAGYEVVIVDNLSTGNKRNIPEKSEFYEGDINDREFIDKIIKKHDIKIINHHAAQIDVRISVADPVYDATQNIIGSLNLISAGIENGLEKFIFASTGGAIYGEPVPLPTNEETQANPLSPYGVAKKSIELYLSALSRIHDFIYVSLRYGNVYGPRQNAHGEAGVIAIFSERMLKGEKTTIFGDGNNTRDYVYCIDVARANLLALNCHISDYFNIGTSVETNVNEIYADLKKLTSYELAVNYGEARSGEQKRSCLEWWKAKEILGWYPKYNLEDGLSETVEYFRGETNNGMQIK
ncbi:MAG: NAD-dependent epimerase/dehydratase family protein [Candidatus Coatesbacteria bacterium]|nr:NAD-dependent epimerase/dehydratase family protein [Candidatus Coatesbacteria bacterium]